MSDADISRQRLHEIVVKYLLNESHIFIVIDVSEHIRGDSGAFLTSVLQGMKCEVDVLRDILSSRGRNAHDAAFIVKFVVIRQLCKFLFPVSVVVHLFFPSDFRY